MTDEQKIKISQAMTKRKKSEEHKRNISLALKGRAGRKWTDEQRKAYSLSKKGKFCHLWKGGIHPINLSIRGSFEFRMWRSKVYERDNWTCVKCGERGGRIHAHHIKSFSKYPECRFDVDNGETLCVVCHSKEHSNLRRLKIKEG